MESDRGIGEASDIGTNCGGEDEKNNNLQKRKTEREEGMNLKKRKGIETGNKEG